MSDPRDDSIFARVLGEVVPDAVIIHDVRGAIRDVNEALCQMTGYSREELLELNVADIEMHIDPGAFWDDMSTDEVFTVEGRHLRKDGTSYPIEAKVAAFMTEDEKVIVGLCRDMTQRKAREDELERLNVELAEAHEKAIQASEAKSTFLASVSHELRTPLNAIIGYSEMLSEAFVEEGLEEHIADIDRIQAAGRQLLALINDVLDLSKIEAGRMEVEVDTFVVEELVEELESTVLPLVRENGNTLVVNSALPADYTVHSDEGKIRQVLLNLLSNACKFTSEGEIEFRVDPEERDGDDGVRWTVVDTGIGMTSEQLGRIFDEYAQAEQSTQRQFGGTGLGLAISRQFCWLLGGEIEVESESGEGSSFSVWLPRDARDVSLPEVEQEDSEASASTVLVIDDDPDARELLRRAIEREGYEVLLAGDGREGLRMAREHQPMAITLDLLMPEPDGWTVLSLLKRNPDLATIPVILVSMVEGEERGFALGASEFVAKPIDRSKLIGMLGRLREDREVAGPVLVVEDDEPTRAMLARTLSAEGWEVQQAPDGVSALKMVDETRPGVVLLDLMMPEMDGFEFLAAFRETPEHRDTPVVVLTARDLTSDDRRRLEGGVSSVLRKSGTSTEEVVEELRALVARAADRERMRE